jgi:Flp pilus assembly protein TadB
MTGVPWAVVVAVAIAAASIALSILGWREHRHTQAHLRRVREHEARAEAALQWIKEAEARMDRP